MLVHSYWSILTGYAVISAWLPHGIKELVEAGGWKLWHQRKFCVSKVTLFDWNPEVQPCRLWWRSRQRKPAPILDETTTDQCGSIGALFFTRPWNGMKQIRSSSHMNWRVGNSYYHLNTWFQGNNQWTIRNFEQGSPHVWCPYYLLGNRSLGFILQWWNMFNLKFAGEPASTPTFFSIWNPIVNMVLTEHVFGENIPTQCL